MTLLTVSDLHVRFETDEGTVRAVDGVDLSVDRGRTLCIVGESGAGKTVVCEAITRLFPTPPGSIAGGSVEFDGTDLTELTDERLREFRGGRIGHVFQDPQGALNPVYTVGWQLREAIDLHHDVDDDEARRRAVDLLREVGIPDASATLERYPHELSGGMRQRVLVAMALAPDPDLLIADEPTTALDVTIQAQILRLFDRLQERREMAIIFVTHDAGVVAEIADSVLVMYGGTVVERGGVFDVFDRPAHPYTQALLECLPGRGSPGGIPGAAPDPTDPPEGCRFHPRCPHAIDACGSGDRPELVPVGPDAGSSPDHTAACVFLEPGRNRSVVLGTEDGDASGRTGCGVRERDPPDEPNGGCNDR